MTTQAEEQAIADAIRKAENDAANSLPAVAQRMSDGLQAWMDAKAKAYGYEDIARCCTYFNSSIPDFKREAIAAVAWRDAVWVTAGELQYMVMHGLRALPTPEELIAEMPNYEEFLT